MERGDAWICVQLLGSGYAAVMMHMASEDGYTYPEPWDTGYGRYATHEEAEREARSWAQAEELPFREARW